MALWIDRYNAHALWSRVGEARALINSLALNPDDRAEQDALAYIGMVIELLERRRKETEPGEVEPSMLEETGAAVADWVGYLQMVRDETWTAQQVVPYADAVVRSLAHWPPLKPAQYLSGIHASVESFNRKIGDALDRVSEQIQSTNAALETLQTEQGSLEASIASEKQRISEAIADFKTTSTAAIDSLIEEQRSRWSDAEAAYRERADDLLAKLTAHEEAARKTVHATTALVVATDYGRYARNKTWAAWICDIAAALVGAAGVGAILFHLFTIDPDADSNIGLSLTRLAASLGALGVAALLGRRGAQHHREARAAKRTDLALRRVGPFIADLPKEEQELIVLDVTDRVFIRGELDSVPDGAEPGSSLQDRILKLRREREEKAAAETN